MVSKFPQSQAQELGSEPEAPESELREEGFRVLDRVREVFCGLHGHDHLMQFKRDRLFLKCVSCGHESPGWELKDAEAMAQPDDRARRQVVRPDVTGERRIA